MCGIVGYLGASTNVKSIVDVLAKLEYRGYDSAGVCCHENKKLNAIKSVGKIEKLNLEKLITLINTISNTEKLLFQFT